MTRQEQLTSLSNELPFRGELRRLVRNITRSHADTDDVLQQVHADTYLKLSLNEEFVIDDLRRYLRRAVRNAAVDVLRNRRDTVRLESVEVTTVSPEDYMIARQEVLEEYQTALALTGDTGDEATQLAEELELS